VEHFVRKHAVRMNKGITYVQKKTLTALMNWNWPGNVRELENFVERAMILTQGSVLAAPLAELQLDQITTPKTLEGVEREHIIHVLRDSGGLVSGPTGAAARLGMPRTTLQSKLKKLRISRSEYRSR
jgi:DNA-binding NtrC family response regulator